MMKTELCKELEQEIILLYEYKPLEEKLIQELLSIRKRVLDKHFEFNEDNYQQLYECNERMKQALLQLQSAYIQADNLKHELSNQYNEVEFEVSCRPVLEYNNILQNALCEYGWGGFEPNIYGHTGAEITQDEDELFYMKAGSWDEGLPKEWAKDIQLTHAFHHLFDHTYWALEDILSIQEYEIKVKYELTEPVTER